jgi:hypothetical protein
MSLEEAILDAVRALPFEMQQEVLNHATRLRSEAGSATPRRSAKGLWADLGIVLSREDIDANRREIWKSFPREKI